MTMTTITTNDEDKERSRNVIVEKGKWYIEWGRLGSFILSPRNDRETIHERRREEEEDEDEEKGKKISKKKEKS